MILPLLALLAASPAQVQHLDDGKQGAIGTVCFWGAKGLAQAYTPITPFNATFGAAFLCPIVSGAYEVLESNYLHAKFDNRQQNIRTLAVGINVVISVPIDGSLSYGWFDK